MKRSCRVFASRTHGLRLSGFKDFGKISVAVVDSLEEEPWKVEEDLASTYTERGPAALSDFMRQASFLLIDHAAGEIHAARDVVGLGSLFFADTPQGTTIANDIALLVRPGDKLSVCSKGLIQYLTFQYTPAPFTLLSGVQKLHPGEVRTYRIRDGALVGVQRLSPLNFGSNALSGRELEDVFGEVYGQLRDSVAGRKVGVLASGGVDSTTNALWLKRVGADPVLLTASFQDPEFDETPYVRDLSTHLGLSLRTHVVTTQSRGDLTRLIGFLAEPICDRALIPTGALLSACGYDLNSIVSGEGGDELWGPPRRWPAHIELGAPFSTASDLASTYLRASAATSIEDRRLMLNSSLAAEIEEEQDRAAKLLESLMAAAEPQDCFQAVKAAQVGTWLPENVIAKDRAAAGVIGARPRFPLAHRLCMQFVASLPNHEHLCGCGSKEFLRLFHRGSVPESVWNKPKHKFKVPPNTWLTQPVAEQVCRQIRDGGTGLDRFFSAHFIDSLAAESSRLDDRLVWGIHTLTEWLDAIKARAGSTIHDEPNISYTA